MTPPARYLAAAVLGLTTAAPHAAADNCRVQARELAATAASDILPAMTAEQRRELQALAADICKRHGSGAAPAKETAEAEDAGDEGSDWFTEHILEGEPADKPGNRRLKRRSR